MRVTLVAALAVAAAVSSLSPASVRSANAQGGRQRSGDGRSGAPRVLSEEDKERTRIRLGITKEQQAKIEALHADMSEKRRDIGSKMRDLYRKLSDLYDSYDYDRDEARKTRREIGVTQLRMLALQGENEDSLRRILNREQFQRLRDMIKEQFEKMRSSMRQRPGADGGPSTRPAAP